MQASAHNCTYKECQSNALITTAFPSGENNILYDSTSIPNFELKSGILYHTDKNTTLLTHTYNAKS